MGACSSKPKTTEFEGSAEPLKGTGVASADRSRESVDTAQISKSNEPGKQEIGAAESSTEALQQTSPPISSKDEEPKVKESSTEGGVPHSAKAEADREAHGGTAEGGNVNNGIVQKGDEIVGAVDSKGIGDKVSTDEGGSFADLDKDFEDKAVVSNEAGTGLGDMYVDKGVAAANEIGQGSGSASTQDEQSENFQDIPEPRGVESPITGVVQPADPAYGDDASEGVGMATLESPAPVHPPGSKSPVGVGKDDLTDRNAPQDIGKLSPLTASVVNNGISQERSADDARGKEEFPPSTSALCVKDKSEPGNVEDTLGATDERTIEPQEVDSLKKGDKEQHAEVLDNEGDAGIVDGCQLEAPYKSETKDAKTSSAYDTGISLVKADRKKDDHVVEEKPAVNGTLPQILSTEESAEDGKLEAIPDEWFAKPGAEIGNKEKESKPHIEEVGAIKGERERVDAGNRVSPVEKERNGLGEGDFSFEDASDVPLKV